MVNGCIGHSRNTGRRVSECLIPLQDAEVAQSVEHMTENHGVGSSILPLGTTFPNELRAWTGGCQIRLAP